MAKKQNKGGKMIFEYLRWIILPLTTMGASFYLMHNNDKFKKSIRRKKGFFDEIDNDPFFDELNRRKAILKIKENKQNNETAVTSGGINHVK